MRASAGGGDVFVLWREEVHVGFVLWYLGFGPASFDFVFVCTVWRWWRALTVEIDDVDLVVKPSLLLSRTHDPVAISTRRPVFLRSVDMLGVPDGVSKE